MRKISLFLVVSFAVSTMAYTGIRNTNNRTVVSVSQADQDTLVLSSLFQQYRDSLLTLAKHYQSFTGSSTNSYLYGMSPYFYQMLTPGTFYRQPVNQAMYINWQPGQQLKSKSLVSDNTLNDIELSRLYYSRQALSYLYSQQPSLVYITQDEIEEAGSVLKDVDEPVKTDTELHEEIKVSTFEHDDLEQVEAILRKPNFWKLKGSSSLNLTQNYATDNWFQGKANHYNVMGSLSLEANYDNKRKVQLDNRLEMQLGFQTDPDNEYQNFKPTNNLIRVNSKLGIKAAKNWNYALSVKGESQLVPNYQYKKNGEEVRRTTITDFLSPLNVDVALGIDWKWNLKRFSGSLMLAPGTYNFKYVKLLDLATRYLGGDREGHHNKHTFGPSSTVRFNWKMANNINWDSRLYWISNLHYTNLEFENTITFSINKYLTSKVYFYPRFNDMSKKNRMPDKDGNNTGTYWMFKEWLSLGVSYSW